MSGKPAARLNDPTACPIPGHGNNPIAAGSPDVLFDGLPAARQGDPSACGGALASAVIPTVLINGKPATTIGTVGSHGNVVTAGSGTVLIGTSGGGAAFTAPAPVVMAGVFNEHFVLRDASSGQPLTGHAYRLETDSGKVIHGVTDEQGKTQLISAGKAEGVTLTLEPQTALVIA
ncbi:PAAR domain-containing protein [Pseudomonas sp. LPB0260]|uniref:PAAR domain-containing protein n=1 Tax=Pseudomonas sp. LPB0260 TaxID=2614442 RepID=UPI0015C21E17|nr:PAAR domain-containing protein [Pseudomonas sp. LPB0260]QLC73200.1 PAAR domain-containing protein [Pseudomonas sp. LPB0260]QLC75974.1 PAAR domain-containing protein [Pseudomonas sp. LPB0260]